MRDRVAAPPGVVAAELGRIPAIEWPTLSLAAAIYLGFAGLTRFHAGVPGWLLYPALVWIVAWHGSLQHEVLHGHPTRLRRFNDALGTPPLALWLPYAIYRRSHLRHHVDARLTDPFDDPESFYWTPELWAPLSRLGKLVVRVQTTLLGRLLLGPAWSVGRFYYFQTRAVWHAAGDSRRLWARHLLGVVAVFAWLVGVCGFDPLLYVLLVVYPATALQLVRSFAEHRAVPQVHERSAIVENAPVFGLLFLFNNLHAVHHIWPRLPWYRIPRLYRRHRDALIGGNGGLIYDGYADVARRFLLRPHDQVMHPLERTEAEPA